MGPEPLVTVPEDREITVPSSRGTDGGHNILQGDKSKLSSQSDSFADLVRQVAVDPLGRINGKQVASLPFRDLLSLLPGGKSAALQARKPQAQHSAARLSAEHMESVSFAEMREFIAGDAAGLRAGLYGIRQGMRVAVVMPNSPHMFLATLYTMCYACAVPLSANSTPKEMVADLRGCQVALVLRGMRKEDQVVSNARKAGVPVVLLGKTSHAGLFEVVSRPRLETPAFPATTTALDESESAREPCTRQDTVLVLSTSGSTGTKKKVPFTLEMMVTAALCLARSRQLTRDAVCLSMLPLYHVAGISRNLAPLLLGATVVFAGQFDTSLFWEYVEEMRISYYAATPTMHQAILETFRDGAAGTADKHSLGTIESVGGALAPSLASELATWFAAKVVQGYALTECMPVTCPAFANPLAKPGSVGVPVGPELRVVDEKGAPKPPGKSGRIHVRGGSLFRGYLDDANEGTFLEGGWFDTGDLGFVDADGYLFITGRVKEVINRGGETLSPFEIEDAIGSLEAVKEVMAFSTSHSLHQETVGVALVHHEGTLRVGIQDLHKHLEGQIHRVKWPQLIVYMDDLPKSTANKVLRTNFSKRAQLPQMHIDTPALECLYEAEAPPKGESVKKSISCAPITIVTKDIEDVLRRLPGVTGATVMRRTLRQGMALVAFVTPPTTQAEHIIRSLRAVLHAYQVPDYVVPVAELPFGSSAKGTAINPEVEHRLQSVQDLGSMAAAEVGLDSLGFIVQKNSIYHLETKVRDNCYVVFILGTVVDHLLDCFASFSSERQCIFIHGFAQKWVEQIAMAVGGTHCQIGMLAIAGYLHSARGRKLQMYDAALFAVYMGFRWVFPWIFYWMLGEWSHPAQFAVPRWFLLAILESRLVLAGTETLRTNLPSKYKFLAEVVLAGTISTLLVAGMCWRDWYHTPYFDLCNHAYHTDSTCNFALLFLYEIHSHAIWIWPEQCFWIATYLIWFSYNKNVVQVVLAVHRALGEEWCQKWMGLVAGASGALYMLIALTYTRHELNDPYFMFHVETDMSQFHKDDQYVIGRMQDLVVFHVQAFLIIFIGSKVPFHLQVMGGNALGVYVCQFAFIAMLQNGRFFQTLEEIQSDHNFGRGVWGGLAQLSFIFGLPLLYWIVFGTYAMEYVLFLLHLSKGVVDELFEAFVSITKGIRRARTRVKAHPRSEDGPYEPMGSEHTPLLGAGGDSATAYSSVHNRPVLGGGSWGSFTKTSERESAPPLEPKGSAFQNQDPESGSIGASMRAVPSWGSFTFSDH